MRQRETGEKIKKTVNCAELQKYTTRNYIPPFECSFSLFVTRLMVFFFYGPTYYNIRTLCFFFLLSRSILLGSLPCVFSNAGLLLLFSFSFFYLCGWNRAKRRSNKGINVRFHRVRYLTYYILLFYPFSPGFFFFWYVIV